MRSSMHVVVSLAALAVGLSACRSIAPPPAVIHSPNIVGVISPRPFQRWQSAYRLQNKEIEVVVVPETGRIHSLSEPEGSSLLWQNDVLGSHLNLSERMHATTDGIAFGVDLDNVAAADAPELLQSWESKAWINEDGSQACHLTRTLPAPHDLAQSLLITLDADSPQLIVMHRITSMGASRIKVHPFAAIYVPPDLDCLLPGNFYTPAWAKDVLELQHCERTTLCGIQQEGNSYETPLSNAWMANMQSSHALSLQQLYVPPSSETITNAWGRFSRFDGHAEMRLIGASVDLLPAQTHEVRYRIRMHEVVDWPNRCDSAAHLESRILKRTP